LERRFNGLYFWSYWLLGIHMTFLNLWLKREGLSGTAIGTLSAVMSGVAILFTPILGPRFDASRRQPGFLALLAVLSGLFYAFFAFHLPFWGLCLAMAGLSFCWTPLTPFLNSMALHSRAAQAASRGFGGYRRWGSAGFAVAGAATGWLSWATGLWIIFPAYLLCALGTATLSSGIPRDSVTPHAEKSELIPAMRQLVRLPVFRALALLSFVYAIGNSICWGFRSIYLDSIGVPERHIGQLWFLPIFAEMVALTFNDWLVARLGAPRLILAGTVAGGLRWVLLSFVTSLPAVYTVEILHGVSFALYIIGYMEIIRHLIPARLSTTSQLLLSSSASGTGGALGALVGGLLFDHVGVIPQLRIGGIILALSGLFAPKLWTRIKKG
jgi:predicted MFS family arabinose efflux permease